MEKLNKLCYKYLKYDKLLHFFFGSVIFYFFLMLFGFVVAFSVLVLLSLLKELYDYLSKKGTPEVLDVVFSILPGVLYLISTFQK